MSIRVLHVIPSVAARDGGPSAAVIGMCRALAAVGCTAAIATTDADGPTRLDVPLGARTSHRGVPTTFFRRVMRGGYKWSPSLAAWLRRHVADYSIVHVHAVFSHASVAAGRACRRAGIPYVVRPLGTLDPWSLGRKAIRKRALLAAGSGALLRGAAAIHYTTAEEGRLAERAAGPLPRGVVVPNGVDEEYFLAPSSAGSPRFVSLSRLHPKKGIDRLIASFHELADWPPAAEWRLTIAGTGEPEYVAMLHGLAAGGAASARIQFAGWIEGEAKRRLLSSAGAFVLPSSQENFGIAVAEALASGVPAIVTRAVNLAPAIEAATAGWIAGEGPEGLTRALREVIAGGQDRVRRGQQARALAQAFRWPIVATAMMAVYREILSPAARGGRHDAGDISPVSVSTI